MKSTKLKETKSTIRFSGKVSGLHINLPQAVGTKFPPKGVTTVEGIINSFPFQTATIEVDTKGNHVFKLTKAMHTAVNRDAEEIVTVEITRIADETETRVPAEFRKALEATPRALAVWEDITPIARRDWIFWIISGKKEETRKIRIEKGCSKLSSGMRRVCCFAGIHWLMKNA